MGLDSEVGVAAGGGCRLGCSHPGNSISCPLSQQTTHPPWMRALRPGCGGHMVESIC